MKKPKSFEDGMSRLEEILELIAQENTPIAQAVKLYAEAAQLVEYCNGELTNATLKIEEIDATLQSKNQQIQIEDDIL